MATYRLQDPNYTYENDWDAFLAKLARYGPKTIDSLVNEAKVDQKLAMIVGLSAAWRANYSRANYLERVRQEQARIIEERRMTPNPAAFRPYLDDNTRAMLPPIKLHRRYQAERLRDRQRRDSFWGGIARGSFRGKSLATIIARESIPWSRRMCSFTYGPPPSPAELTYLFWLFRVMNPRPRRKRLLIDPAGMTPERALAIATRVMEAKAR